MTTRMRDWGPARRIANWLSSRENADFLADKTVRVLIGALAFILAALALVIATAGVVIGRGHGARSRAALMAAGMSKRTLLAAETAELGVQGLAAFAVSLPLSALGALCLTNALGLFGLYFGYMFEAWIAVAAGAAIALLFAAVPLVFGFRRHYDMRRSV